MEPETHSPSEQYETDLLDILVTLAESWKLLVIGPLLAGVVAWLISFMWPACYVSTAILRLSEEDAALSQTESVQNALLAAFPVLNQIGKTQEDRRAELKRIVTYSVDKKTKFVTLKVKSEAAETAQAMVKTTIAAILDEALPKGRDRQKIQEMIELNDSRIQYLEATFKSMAQGLGQRNIQGMDSVKFLTTLGEEIERLTRANIDLRFALERRGDEIYIQPASLPDKKAGPSNWLVAGVVGL